MQAAFAPHAAEGLVPARVSVAYGATFRVVTEDGEYLADSTGRMRHEAQGRRDLPAVGDWVAVKPATAAGGRATIQAILPRKSVFSRKAAGTDTTEQILATNVDTAFLMTAFDQDLNLRRLERYLAMTWESGATPVILINKTDLSEEVDALTAGVGGIALGVPVHGHQREAQRRARRARPRTWYRGSTLVVLGSSGVGKSTLINRLVGNERLATQEVRDSDHRGKHTTTHRELIVLPGGALLIDTPGMRELQLWSADAGVAEAFDDICAHWRRSATSPTASTRSEPQVRGQAGGGGGPPAGRAARTASTSCAPSRTRSPPVRTSWPSRTGRSATGSAPARFARSPS